MGLFDRFKNKSKNDGAIVQKTASLFTQSISNDVQQKHDVYTSSDRESDGYYFADLPEFVIYCKTYDNGKNVKWLRGDDYTKEFQKGYQLFEQNQFSKAIEAFNNSLKLNPIGLAARFEICESYLGLHQFSAAKHTLLDMKNYLLEDKNIAKFYRRMGYIEIEEGNFQCAAACYQYSLKFENHPTIVQELAYIRSKAGGVDMSGNPETILRKAGLPILTAISLS